MTGLSPNHRSLGGFLSLRSALLPIWPAKNYRITNGYTGLCVGRIAIWTHELLASYSALWTLNSPWLKHVWYRLAPHMENRETIGSLNLLHWSLTRAWSAGLNTWAFDTKVSLGWRLSLFNSPYPVATWWADEIAIIYLPGTATRFFKNFRLTLTSWVGYYLLSSITHWDGLMYVFEPNRLMIKIIIATTDQTS